MQVKKKNLKIGRGLYKMYDLYTLPTCDHCIDTVKFMKERKIEFNQIDAGSSEGIKKFREFYSKYRTQIKRDDSGCAILPIICKLENELKIHQGREGLEEFLSV